MKRARFTRIFPTLAGLALVSLALSGCSGSDHESPTVASAVASAPNSLATTSDSRATTAAVQDEGASALNPIEVAYENEIAGCMRRQGFRYVPHPSTVIAGYDDPVDLYAGEVSLLQPDDAVRKWRQKYGFGLWSEILYRNDPGLTRAPAATNDPNKAIVAALDRVQRSAYNIALRGTDDNRGYDPKTMHGKAAVKIKKAVDNSCQVKAAGLRAAKMNARKKKHSAAENQAAEQLNQKFFNDPAVIAAANQYADCLKNRGYKFHKANTRPGAVEVRSSSTVWNMDFPDLHRTESLAQAKRGLIGEIKIAVDDVDCRSPYAAIVRTKYPKYVTNMMAGLPDDPNAG